MQTAIDQLLRVAKKSVINMALREYTDWLAERGYLDSDYWQEYPHSVDDFMEDKMSDQEEHNEGKWGEAYRSKAEAYWYAMALACMADQLKSARDVLTDYATHNPTLDRVLREARIELPRIS